MLDIVVCELSSVFLLWISHLVVKERALLVLGQTNGGGSNCEINGENAVKTKYKLTLVNLTTTTVMNLDVSIYAVDDVIVLRRKIIS